MTSQSGTIQELVNQWLALDVNPSTSKEIIDLHNEQNFAELESRLRKRIQFGTAGLRAKMEAGFSRMNDVTVLQASQGLASYVLLSNPDQASSVVVGHDHRHNSKKFSQITATVFLLKGFKVYLLESSQRDSDLVPTPCVPFAVDYYGAQCGVMITASHNPAADNGYKVYWSNGCQIIPPHDTAIAAEIEWNLEPLERSHDIDGVFKEGLDRGLLIYCKEEVLTAYILHLNSRVVRSKVTDLQFIYTAMHGVGYEVFEKAVKLLGVQSVATVTEQEKPDPDFPTVRFPNPEEKGALGLAMERASLLGVDLIIANDPDADRFSAAVRTADGGWKQLTGNEIGFLFADYVLRSEPRALDKMYLLNSTVSSQMIKSMADHEGFHYADTLTGFKWIGNEAIKLEQMGYDVPFGYEEAIGFMFPGIHDKDGISAALVFLQMAQEWKDRGVSALDVLEDGYRKYGYFKEHNSYYIVPSPDKTKIVFDENIRPSKPRTHPETIGQYKVTYWRDLTLGYDSLLGQPELPVDASSQMITVKLVPLGEETGKEEIRFTARGSGTEPKLKVYIEAKAESEYKAQYLADNVWDTLREEWFKPSETGLMEL